MVCVNINSREFKEASSRLDVNLGELELIVHKFINLEGNEDKFPTDDYIKELLLPQSFTASEKQLEAYFKAKHFIPIQVNTQEDFNYLLKELRLLYPSSAIRGYKNASGKYTIQVATPKVEGIPMVLDNSMIDNFTQSIDENNPYHSLFNATVKALGKENISINMQKTPPTREDGRIPYANYDPRTNQITFFIDSILQHKNTWGYSDDFVRRYLFQTLTHELLHQLTVATVANPLSAAEESFANNINLLYNEALEHFGGDKEAFLGLTDVREFISEAMTNLKFQRELAKIKSKQGNKIQSLWNKLADAFCNYFKEKFGLDIRNTILADTMASIEDFMGYVTDFEEQQQLYNESMDYIEGTPNATAEESKGYTTALGELYDMNASYRGYTIDRFTKKGSKFPTYMAVIPGSGETALSNTTTENRDTYAEAVLKIETMLSNAGLSRDKYGLSPTFRDYNGKDVIYITPRRRAKDKVLGSNTNKRQNWETEASIKRQLRRDYINSLSDIEKEAFYDIEAVRSDLAQKLIDGLIDISQVMNDPSSMTTLASAFSISDKWALQLNNYTPEMQEILKNASRNSEGKLLAPNGKPTKLDERQWLQVRTKAFKEWFGDWENDPKNASKVVDENGEPLVVYHGTRSDFNTFSKDFLGKLTGASSAKKAFFAASSPANSAVYANFQDEYSIWQSYTAANEGDVSSLGIEKEPEEPSLSEIYPTFEGKIRYLERKYPEIIKKARENVGTTNRPIFSPEGELVSEIEEQHPDDVLNYIFQNAKNESKYFQSALKDLFGLTTLDDIQQQLRGQLNDNIRQFYDSRLKPVFLNIRDPKIDNDNNQGYRSETYSNRIDAALSEDKDGGIILNTADPLPTNVYYFFDPNQIKSATDNNGEYSTTDNDIQRNMIQIGLSLREYNDLLFELSMSLDKTDSFLYNFMKDVLMVNPRSKVDRTAEDYARTALMWNTPFEFSKTLFKKIFGYNISLATDVSREVFQSQVLEALENWGTRLLDTISNPPLQDRAIELQKEKDAIITKILGLRSSLSLGTSTNRRKTGLELKKAYELLRTINSQLERNSYQRYAMLIAAKNRLVALNTIPNLKELVEKRLLAEYDSRVVGKEEFEKLVEPKRELFEAILKAIRSKHDTERGEILFNEETQRDSTYDEVVERITSTNPEFKDLLKLFKNANPDLKIKVGGNPERAVEGIEAGKFSPKTNTLYLTNSADVYTTIHELAHAATYYGIVGQSESLGPFEQQINQFMDYVRDYIRKELLGPKLFSPQNFMGVQMNADIYGFTNASEFIAELFGNPKFQELLARIPAMEEKQFKSLLHQIWDSIINFFNSVLGKGGLPQNALDQAKELGYAAMSLQQLHIDDIYNLLSEIEARDQLNIITTDNESVNMLELEQRQDDEDPFHRRSLRITNQVNTLYTSEYLTNTELKNIAEEVVYWISDFITKVQQNPEVLINDTIIGGKHYEGIDFSTMTRGEVVNKIGADNLMKRAQEQFSPARNLENDYYDGDVIDYMQEVIENFDGLMEIAQPYFLEKEKFSIKLNDLGIAEVEEDLSKNVNADDFNLSNEELDIKETKGSEAEHWLVESRSRDILDDVGKAVDRVLNDCYVLDKEGNRVKSERGVDKRVNKRQATNSILRWIRGATTIDAMIAKLQEKQELNMWVSQIIPKLQDTSGEYSDFLSQFFRDFYKPFQPYCVVKYEDGHFKTMIINEHKALSEISKSIKAQFNTGKHPMFTSDGVNKDTLAQLEEAFNSIGEIIKAKDYNLENQETVDALAKDIAFAANTLGYYTLPLMVTDAITKDNVKSMYTALSWIIKSLNKNINNKNYEPFKFRADGSIKGNLDLFLTPITEQLEDVAVSSFYDNGKMYQSYITPSYMTKLALKMKFTGDDLTKFIEEEYKKYDWFYDKSTGQWLNDWVAKLATDQKARDLFSHKVQLNFNKKNYMKDMSDMEYALSLITEYFSVVGQEKESTVPAWFRIPMISNKPSSEFIRFYSYRGITYQTVLTRNLKKVFDQELRRIQTVTMRNRSKNSSDYITNLDKNGRKFCFLTFMNQYLEGTPSAHAEFAKLLKDKIAGKEIDESKLYSEALAVIREEMDAKAKETVADWEKLGMLEAAKKVPGLGKTPEEIKKNLENFVWNDFYAAINIMLLTVTDIAYYKNAEDLQKRLAQIHSPGLRPNVQARDYNGRRVSDNFTRTFYLTDFENVLSNIIENVGIVFDRKIEDARRRGQETEARGYEVLKDSLVRPRTYKADGTIDDEGGAFYNINVTDAQGYACPTSYRKKAFLFGKWSKEAEAIYERLKKGDYTLEELKTVFLPLKPFVYSQIEKKVNAAGAPMQNFKMGVQNKNSEYLLIMADALMLGEDTGKPNLLRAIYDVMENSHFDRKTGEYKVDGIDTVQFASTVKTGLMGAIDITKYVNMENGEDIARSVMEAHIYEEKEPATQLVENKETQSFETKTIENAEKEYKYNDTHVHTIPLEDYSLQQETPEHFKNHEQQHGSQGRYIIPSELAEIDAFGNEVLYSVKNVVTTEDGKREVVNEKINANEFKKRYENNIAENINESIQELQRELQLNGTEKERNIAISKVLLREILSSPRYGVDLLLACSVDENGMFRIPLGDPILSKRIEQLLNSIIKNRVNKLKIPGGPVVLVSNFGTSRELNIRFKDKNGGLLMTRAEWEKNREKIPNEVYHYSNEDNLTEFTQKEDNYFSQEKGGTKNAIFFTDNTAPKEGTVLARNNKYTVKLDAKKVKVVRGTKEDMHKRGTSYTEEVNKAEQEGYDAVRFLNLDDNQEHNLNITVIFDPSKATIVNREQTVPSKKSNESTYEEYVKNNQGGIAHFEVFAPIYSDELLKFTDGKGNIDIDMIELVNPDLLKMVGYRIPTEAKYSMAPLKIVGFLPREAGSAIMLPNDITLLTGSDFDIDKEYLMRKQIDLAWRFEPKGETAEEMLESEKDWIKHNRKSLTNHLMKTVKVSFPATAAEVANIEKDMEAELQRNIGVLDRLHKEKLDKINERFTQINSVEDTIEYDKDPEKDEQKYSQQQRKINIDRKKAIADENARYKNEVKKLRRKYRNTKDDVLNKKIKEFEKRNERNTLKKAINDFLDYGRLLPTKQDSRVDRILRKAYLEYKVKAIEPMFGRDFRNNQIVDMTYEVLTHETTAAELLNPGGFEPQKRMGYMVAAHKDPGNNYTWEQLQSMSTDKLKDLCQVDKNLMDISTHVQFYRQNSAAGSLIGIFAVERVAHAVIENEGYKINVFDACDIDRAFKVLDMVFGGHEEKDEKGKVNIVDDTYMEIDVRQNGNGESVGKTLGSLVASAADAVKDPVLNLMNINSQTANVLNTLIRLGMPFEDAALFLSQSTITDILDTYSRENLIGFKPIGQVINDRMKTLEKENGITSEAKIHNEALSREELVTGLKKEETTPEIEYKVLKAFKNFRNLAEGMRMPTFATRFNSISNAVGPLAIDNLITEYKMRLLSDNSVIVDRANNRVKILHIIDAHPILKQFAATLSLASGTLSSGSLVASLGLLKGIAANSNSFRGLLDTLAGNPDEERNPLEDIIRKDRKLLSALSDFYQSYLLVQSGVIDETSLTYYILEFPQEFLKKDYKSKYKDNLLIQAIRLDSDKAGRLTLAVNLTGVDITDKERMGAAWADLYKQDSKLAVDLFKYCFFRGGIGFNPKSFMALLPLQMKEQIEGYTDTFRMFETVLSPDFFFDQFIRNNWDNNKLVPNLKDLEFRNVAGHDGMLVTFKGEGNQYALADMKYFKTTVKVDGRSVDKMFKITNVIDAVEPGAAPEVYCKEIDPLGSNKDYIEISVNNIDKATDLTVKVEEDELPLGSQDADVTDEAFPWDALDYAEGKHLKQQELDTNILYLRSLAKKAWEAVGNTSEQALSIVDKWKEREETEKNQLRRSTKNFFRAQFDKLHIPYDEKLLDEVYDSIC